MTKSNCEEKTLISKEIESILDANHLVFLKFHSSRPWYARDFSLPWIIIKVYDINLGVEKNVLLVKFEDKNWKLT